LAHIDKYDGQGKGIYTLPVILGERLSRYTVIAMLIFQYLSVAYLVDRVLHTGDADRLSGNERFSASCRCSASESPQKPAGY
jgi:hypothetical protein